MKLLSLCLAFLLLLSTTAKADTEVPGGSYVVPNGTTASVGASSSSTTTAPAAVTPTLTATGVAYDPIASSPPCGNTTCISPQMIANAHHAFVSDSPVKSYISLLTPPDAAKGTSCQQPSDTGITVQRIVVEGEGGALVTYDDAFCLNQGCVYYGLEGTKRCE